MTNQVLPSDLLVELSAEEQQQLAGGCCGASNVPSCGCGDSSRPSYGYGSWGRRRRFGGWGHRTYKYGCR
ncbi:hypothetical protein [Nostoc sp. UHCC 0870]|uniref:hypothetical protein n=1 Tax=Nostoc sp. UHCC 0870 TaxID=2914041 RepID=UPI001EDF1248|nr:hypothetical protein [Nostoc sp. UHCC 0870]UKO99927.1 hypothetical protein L6494_09560 [Nostoc sp. UHCC 0870]